MATIITKKGKNGKTRYQIQFKIFDKRKTLSLGSEYTARQVDRTRAAVEDAAEANETGRRRLDRATSAFLDDNPALKVKFQNAGLIERIEEGTLSGLWDMFDRHCEKMGFKETTLSGYKTARKWFFEYFPEDLQVETITEKDAEEFRAWLGRQNHKYGKPLAPTSVAGIIKSVKTVFNLARRARIIVESPFEWIKKGSMSNPARLFEVPAEIMSQILDACPSQSWRSIFVLWRFGGLRKMEPLLLKWEDILWNAGTKMKGKIRVHSPKTERFKGHAERFCPLFPEIRRELEDLSEMAGPGAEFVLDDDVRDRSPNAIYNAALRIISRAGFTPWERLISNMRATRDSELKRAGFTSDQRTAWLGHDEKVSRDHYQMSEMLVNESDYDRACDFQTLPAEQGGQRSGGTPAGAVDADRIPQTSAF